MSSHKRNKRKNSEEKMNRGKVETISRLARWSTDELDSMGPWSSSNTAEWSNCCSDPFKIGIWEWSIAISKHENNNEAFYGLCFKSPSVSKEHPLVARFTFRMLATEYGRSPHNSRVYEKGFWTNRYFWAVRSIPHCSFFCDVEYLDQKREGLVQSPPPKPILPCLSRMFTEQINTDITINTPGGALKAHRAVLSSNSPVFKSMFSHHLKENQTSVVDIDDMSLESCTLLLNYMYGNIQQEELSKNHLQLLVAADKYGMADLKNACEEGLIEDLNSNNVLERLQAASIYQLGKLKKVCFKYLIDFGMIYELRNEINSFFRHEDKELMLEMLQAIIITWKPQITNTEIHESIQDDTEDDDEDYVEDEEDNDDDDDNDEEDDVGDAEENVGLA